MKKTIVTTVNLRSSSNMVHNVLIEDASLGHCVNCYCKSIWVLLQKRIRVKRSPSLYIMKCATMQAYK